MQVRGSNPCMEVSFCKKTENAVKINNSPQFTVLTAKDVRNTRSKLIVFTALHRIFTKIYHKTSTRMMKRGNTMLFFEVWGIISNSLGGSGGYNRILGKILFIFLFPNLFSFPKLHDNIPNAILPNAKIPNAIIPNMPIYPMPKYPMPIYPIVIITIITLMLTLINECSF